MRIRTKTCQCIGMPSVVMTKADDLEGHKESKDVNSSDMWLELHESKIHIEGLPEGHCDKNFHEKRLKQNATVWLGTSETCSKIS